MLKQKDIKIRQLGCRREKRKNLIKAIVRSHKSFLLSPRYYSTFLFVSKFNLNKITNRCVVTNSRYSIIRFYHVSRNVFRAFATFGTLFGVHKSAW